MIIHSENIVLEQGISNAWLTVENGVIQTISNAFMPHGIADIDYGSAFIIPGIFDTHNHGMLGWYPHSGLYAREDILGYCKALASTGVTSVFPTCTDGSWEGILERAACDVDGAEILGIHSEGPYLNRVGEKGVDQGHPEIAMKEIKKLLADSHGMLKLFAIAPEIDGAEEAISYLASHGVRCAFAHSNADYSEAIQAFQEGITVITHTANVMSGIHHRNIGGLGAALLYDGVYNELICDGMHVCNEMLQIMFRVKKDAFHKFMLISDNVHLGGFPEGKYDGPFGPTHITADGFCLSETGRLSGSTKPVIYGMKNLVKNLAIPIEDVCRMASLNPCKVYGFADRKGSLCIGKDADMAVIDSDFNVLHTYRKGKIIYDQKTDLNLINSRTFNALKAYAV